MTYAYLSFAQLTAALLQRLQDTAGVSTTAAECQIYLTEALRVLNAQTQAPGIVDYQFNFNPGDTWKSLNVAGSPRQRTVTDTAIYTQMEYMLLEPPSGAVWTGTSQFNITNLSNALQYRRDELMQVSGANTINLITNSPVNSRRTFLPDSTLAVRRVRWVPINVQVPPNPYALWREDVTSANSYGDNLAVTPGEPESWMITANSPLAFDVSCPPNVPGKWDMLVLNPGIPLTPPTGKVLGLPDDWCWVAMYGALEDALSNSPEATDITRAKYCRMRYERGMKAMQALPWLLQAFVAALPVDTPSYVEMDAYAQNWENTWPKGDPQIVVGAMDLIAVAPFNIVNTPPNPTVSTVLTLVGNAPVNPANPVQLSQDGVDAVLAYAQHVAMFKNGGTDFLNTMPLYEQFEEYCRMENRRYAALGRFRAETLTEGNRGEQMDPRFEGKEDSGKASR